MSQIEITVGHGEDDYAVRWRGEIPVSLATRASEVAELFAEIDRAVVKIKAAIKADR